MYANIFCFFVLSYKKPLHNRLRNELYCIEPSSKRGRGDKHTGQGDRQTGRNTVLRVLCCVVFCCDEMCCDCCAALNGPFSNPGAGEKNKEVDVKSTKKNAWKKVLSCRVVPCLVLSCPVSRKVFEMRYTFFK